MATTAGDQSAPQNDDQSVDPGRRARVIALYLPQFHPIPENDAWWGNGFTEWANVARAKPLYRGHRQPRLPTDLGFYDLRVPEVREAQGLLAMNAGVEAFCYWHYWFGGRRLLERPFNDVLASGRPAVSFCLGWANESWSGVWKGESSRILVEQTYPGPEDVDAHFRALLPAFRDARYFRVDGKPLFYIFRPELLPDARAFTEQWRDLADRNGLVGLYLVATQVAGEPAGTRGGFDAVTRPPYPSDYVDAHPVRSRVEYRLRKLLTRAPGIYPYEFIASFSPSEHRRDPVFLPMVLSNWDNTPRLGPRGFVYRGSTPDLFAGALERAVRRVDHYPEQQRIVFVKSWNEWAEGNYIEPDEEFGRGYLEALARVIVHHDS